MTKYKHILLYETHFAKFWAGPQKNIIHCEVLNSDNSDIGRPRKFFSILENWSNGQKLKFIDPGLKAGTSNSEVRRLVMKLATNLIEKAAVIVPSNIARIIIFMFRTMFPNPTINYDAFESELSAEKWIYSTP
jgi:hypothetical protein